MKELWTTDFCFSIFTKMLDLKQFNETIQRKKNDKWIKIKLTNKQELFIMSAERYEVPIPLVPNGKWPPLILEEMEFLFKKEGIVMKIGVCKQCISTTLPVHLTGFGNPNRKFTGVHDDIYAAALVLEEETTSSTCSYSLIEKRPDPWEPARQARKAR